MILQFFIAFFGLSSIFLLSSKNIKLLKYGFLCGLLAEPFWFASAWLNDQWGIIIVCVVYMGFYIRGLKNHWSK